MKCPHCSGNMVLVRFHDVELDHCPDCGGNFFDPTELDQLLSINQAEAIDPPQSRDDSCDDESWLFCPRCAEHDAKVRMITMVDADWRRVRFERCPKCGGSWFDGGGFRELKRARQGPQ